MGWKGTKVKIQMGSRVSVIKMTKLKMWFTGLVGSSLQEVAGSDLKIWPALALKMCCLSAVKVWLFLYKVVCLSSILCFALTMKCQNIGSSTQKNYKQIFDYDILDSNKWKYMSLGSFKSHTYCSVAKNGSEVVYQN